MPIKSLELEDVGPFRFRPAAVSTANDFRIRVDFNPEVNLFVGPNNVGKSTILQAVSLLTEPWNTDFRERYLRDVSFPREASSTVALEWCDSGNQNLRLESDYGALSAALTALGGRDNANSRVHEIIRETPRTSMRDDVDFALRETRPDHARRMRRGAPQQSSEQRQTRESDLIQNQIGIIKILDKESSSETCYSSDWDQRKRDDFGYVGYATHDSFILQNLEDLALYSRRHNPFERNVFGTILMVVNQITEGFPMRITISNPEEPSSNIFVDQPMDGRVSISDLSLGTQYVLAWIIQFIVDFAQQYDGEEHWKKRPGIFIIDEIDAHLHPSWQRRIIPTLQRHFPNVQIFASTHSPMMVAGLKKGQVHLLKRNETTGSVEWSRNEQDIIGWTADEIYRTFMGIYDPTDERTARHAEELRELKNKDSLTAEDEVRMQELRRLVNEDLLAGGWLKAQDERFDEMMRQFMANRMSDLSQDGA